MKAFSANNKREFIKDKQKRMHRHMRRHASVPQNLHSALRPHNERQNANSMVGTIMARDTPESNPMLLHLNADTHCLRIVLKQLTNGKVYSFVVAQINYADLITGWIWEDCNTFLLAQAIQGKTYDEIYCNPIDVSRNEWLKFFEQKQVQSMPFFLNRNNRHVPKRKLTRYIIPSVKEIDSGDSGTSQDCTNVKKDNKNYKERRLSMD
jgi:hypothetical protein